jgi:pimeloyl-ACP methyl ester carboxylesterase
MAKMLKQALPNSRTVVMAGLHHLLPQEDPDAVGRRILEFLSD